ncbi:hypothetical protein A3F55_01725 [Candidatus Adlerbacteria bacterium RIFCSPHIGHO2_12_FULL_53_18]|uniref:Uncharacterized protein n=1 Tax=Candidatus Adlerbacteria bacterium RIFCSPHIGHO2_12_FULL_53_18 TaxID=1797242 RepID=A0A1F4XTR3_9BACT|nr:MAG: hypothetical protein A3F55_01725 [Candidatus Adlerbacteria bacterium RIFCSPHIGHO2_12_FULL_53_18]
MAKSPLKPMSANESVSDRIFSAFIDELAHEKDFDAVAARLKGTILEQRTLTEPALRKALFGEDA